MCVCVCVCVCVLRQGSSYTVFLNHELQLVRLFMSYVSDVSMLRAEVVINLRNALAHIR